MAEPAFLLDSNILVYAIIGRPPVLRKRIERQPLGALSTSTICVAEVLVGLSGDADEEVRALERLLEIAGPIPFDAAAAEHFAAMPFKRGKFDRLVAATALSRKLTLVTNNERDFADVPGLKLENWTK